MLVINTAIHVLSNIDEATTRAIDTLNDIQSALSNHRSKQAFNAKLRGTRKQFPHLYEALCENEIMRDELDTYRYWRCRWLMTKSERAHKAMVDSHEKLLDLYGNRSVSFEELADAMGYELVLRHGYEICTKQRVGLNGFQHCYDLR